MPERVRKLLFITSEDGKLFSFPAATRLGYRWLYSYMEGRLSWSMFCGQLYNMAAGKMPSLEYQISP